MFPPDEKIVLQPSFTLSPQLIVNALFLTVNTFLFWPQWPRIHNVNKKLWKYSKLGCMRTDFGRNKRAILVRKVIYLISNITVLYELPTYLESESIRPNLT